LFEQLPKRMFHMKVISVLPSHIPPYQISHDFKNIFYGHRILILHYKHYKFAKNMSVFRDTASCVLVEVD
jgi:hypothetical protein